MDRLQHGGSAAAGVNRAIDPRVAVIAHNNPIVGVLGAWNLPDDVPDDAALIILPGDEVNLHAGFAIEPAGLPYVIAEGQRALPALGHARPCEGLKNRLGIGVADGDGDDMGLVAFRRDPGGVGEVHRGCHAGGLGIAGILEEVLD